LDDVILYLDEVFEDIQTGGFSSPASQPALSDRIGSAAIVTPMESGIMIVPKEPSIGPGLVGD